jgi:hypothetical protein
VSAPVKVGLWHDRFHRYSGRYADTGAFGPLPGVTGTIGILDKSAVAYWRGTTVASIIADKLDLFAEMVKTGGKDAAVKWAGQLPGFERDKAADTGSLVHILVENIVRKREITVDPDLVPYAIAFRRFLEERKPKIISVEHAVANLTDGWGGTFDLYVELDGVKTLLDAKTWKRRPEPGSDMYAETALQLAAYGNAEFTGVDGDPKKYAPPRPDAYAVLHLRPELYERGYHVHPFDVTPTEYEVFRALLKGWRWKQDRAKKVIRESQPMEVAA